MGAKTFVIGSLAVLMGCSPILAQRTEDDAAEAPRLHTTVLDDLLGNDRSKLRRDYLRLGTDPGVAWDHRVLALTRALALAAMSGAKADVALAINRLQEQLGHRLTQGQRDAVDRSRALGAELRRRIEAGADLDELRGVFRNSRGAQINLSRLGRRRQGGDGLVAVQIREMRAAEARGDQEEAQRLRNLITARADYADRARQRGRLARRWAREIAQWDMAGENEKARRLREILRRRRFTNAVPALGIIERIERSPERAEAILARQRQALENERILAAVSARERETIDRAHREAERRIEAGELEAAVRLLGLLAVFLRPSD